MGPDQALADVHLRLIDALAAERAMHVSELIALCAGDGTGSQTVRDLIARGYVATGADCVAWLAPPRAGCSAGAR